MQQVDSAQSGHPTWYPYTPLLDGAQTVGRRMPAFDGLCSRKLGPGSNAVVGVHAQCTSNVSFLE